MTTEEKERATDAKEEQVQLLIDLLARCSLRDKQALKALYDQTSSYLNGVAYRIVKDADTSNEVLQEAYLQIWDNASRYRPHLSQPITWLTSIVRYRALDRLDKERRIASKLAFTEDIDSLDQYSSSDATPEEGIQQLQLQQHLQLCLDTLNQEVKHSIELAYLYGFSREEIAAKLKTNSNTIKSWIHRGAQRLKLCLQTNT